MQSARKATTQPHISATRDSMTGGVPAETAAYTVVITDPQAAYSQCASAALCYCGCKRMPIQVLYLVSILESLSNLHIYFINTCCHSPPRETYLGVSRLAVVGPAPPPGGSWLYCGGSQVKLISACGYSCVWSRVFVFVCESVWW